MNKYYEHRVFGLLAVTMGAIALGFGARDPLMALSVFTIALGVMIGASK